MDESRGSWVGLALIPLLIALAFFVIKGAMLLGDLLQGLAR